LIISNVSASGSGGVTILHYGYRQNSVYRVFIKWISLKNYVCFGAQKPCEACLYFSKLMWCYYYIYCFGRHTNAQGKQNILGSFENCFLSCLCMHSNEWP